MIQNSITEKWINAYIANPTSTLLIESSGNYRQGILIAEFIHSKLIGNINNPIISMTTEKQGVVSVDDVRKLIKKLSLKSNKGRGIQRIVLIENADQLTKQAQNSLLKQTEELPNNTIIILVVLNKSEIISTLLSRCFLIPVLPITHDQAITYAQNNKINESLAQKAFLLSEGNPGLFEDIINENSEDFLKLIDYSKDYLAKTIFEKQAEMKKISDKNFELDNFIGALRVICKSAMRNANQPNSKQLWKSRLAAVLEAQQLLKKSVIKKLIILNLSIKL